MKLTDFKVLTFDCYGTLIDWESGIYEALAPVLARCSPVPDRKEALAAFGRFESAQQQETPSMLYPRLLAMVHHMLTRHFGVESTPAEDERFGDSVPAWPAFVDSAPALQYLKQHYQLVILSNVDRASFARSNERLGVEFDAVYTAQDIGSYKPDPRNFRYLLEHLTVRGVGKADILHTAQSLYHDHVPAKAAGLATAWIHRRHERAGEGATRAPEVDVKPDFEFATLAELVEAHRQAGPA